MAANGTPRRGRLKVFLGYAAGVGKTYQMLTEAQELKRQGVDVVIAEIIDTGLLDELQVPALNSLRDRGVVDEDTDLIGEVQLKLAYPMGAGLGKLVITRA